MNRQPALSLDLDDGIDRKVLGQLRQRFLAITAGRLERARQALSARQERVLRLLPLLFHINHPLLPGYLSATVPAGLSGFEPDPQALAEAQRLARSFCYKPRRQDAGQQPIHGLFLMGSLGSLAQEEQSDLDLWVCHAADLDAAARRELRRKCALIEDWARAQGCEAHCFLIDVERFGRGEDDGGNTQHFLLLDEFYRSAIWLGGRTPLWWLVPPAHEQRYDEYCRALLGKRFVRAEEVLDLGHLARIPAREFIAAGLWQLSKAIDSPYKSLLKLLLTEAYASEHPRVGCVALRFKEQVFAGQLDLDALDPYVLVYRHLERYLQERQAPERLELVRRCLYLKVGRKLGGRQRQARQDWQLQSMERLAAEWQWQPRRFALLDSRSQWKMRQVLEERRCVVNELTYSYRLLFQFARRQGADSGIDSRDLGLLGRRLYAAFERKAGKVEHINPGIAPDLGEDVLTLVQRPAGSDHAPPHWAIYPGALGVREWPDYAPLQRAGRLVELLAWCHRNGVIDSATRLSLHPGQSDLGEPELSSILASLRQFLPLPLASVDDAELLQPRRSKRALLLVNVGIDPLRHHSQMNLHMATGRTDVLGYAGVRDNLVLTLDLLGLNSWNELTVRHYEGPQALPECLADFLDAVREKPGAPPRPPDLAVRCFCRNRAEAIAQRVEALFRETYGLLLGGQPSRYLLQVRQHYHLLELSPESVSHASLPDLPSLLQHLGRERGAYSALKLDRHALEGEDLGPILSMGRPGCIQVFYRRDFDSAEIILLDERNSLWRQRQALRDERSLLAPLQRFLQSLLYRRSALSLAGPTPASLDIHYYEVLAGAGALARIEPREAPEAPASHPLYEIQAVLERGERKRVQVTLYCDHREFSELEYGAGLYRTVARHILAHRAQAEPYPCYLTDLDLSRLFADEQPQTLHYLRYKSVLETALNQALLEQ
ncbi:class I adenylate cyclase [Pseudomonas paraeruginosa]|uniref:class I adenylate cyclase n=1 Tax=Pseudomonas paraeruginosa TaxID=2994495 RepID=UPI000D14F7CE|nr:class I adenylate cyclase [Pseudomonas paraeruginosa]AVR70427.1 class I adenylate cyclase [Pseudomonas paraeruginosa]